MNKSISKESIIELLQKGYTVERTARELNISRQTVYNKVNVRDVEIETGISRYKRYNIGIISRIIYIGIREYMYNNGISISKLSEMTGINTNCLSGTLRGKHSPRKETIDKILQATGLQYEYAFETEEE